MSFNCLKDCNGACCRWIILKGRIAGDNSLWEMRGLKSIEEYGGRVAIPCTCKHLSDKGVCMIWGTEKRPEGCGAEPVGNEQCHMCRKLENQGSK